LFSFANTSASGGIEGEDTLENPSPRLLYHSNQVIRTLNKIVHVLKSTLSEETTSSRIALIQDQEQLFEKGERHYHYGIKTEHFIIFEDCFIQSLKECLSMDMFYEKFETPWRKLIRYIFKQYTNGMNYEKNEEIKSEIKRQKSVKKQISDKKK